MSFLLLTSRQGASGGGGSAPVEQPDTGFEVLVLEADAIEGKADGEAIGSDEWPDASGNAHTINREDANGGPVWKENRANGHPAVLWDGTEQTALECSTVAGNTTAGWTEFFIVRDNGEGTATRYLRDGAGTYPSVNFRSSSPAGWHARAQSSMTTDTLWSAAGDTLGGGDFHLLRIDWKDNATAVYLDGEQVDSGIPGTNDLSGITLGGFNDGQACFDGEIAAYVLLQTPDAAGIEAWETYLGAKYDVG